MTFFAFCIVCLGFALLLFYQYGSNKVSVTCECLMTASIISPDTTTCCLGQGPPAKLLSNIRDEDDGGDGDGGGDWPCEGVLEYTQ